ncbi:MAG: M20/M25/M40 family metallo-hydrolase [Fimbriimonadaceae bacterium]
MGLLRITGAAVFAGLIFIAPGPQKTVADRLREKGLREMGAYSLLTELCTKIGPRLSGSSGAAKAVRWGRATMERLGFQNVRLIPCMVPRWVRGKEELWLRTQGSRKLNCVALGGSIGTPPKGLEADVIEVKSLEEAAKLGAKARGKILFFNRPMDQTLQSTFEAYGGAVDQRSQGASAAAKVGAVAMLVRSMTLESDDVPHTGALRYQDGVRRIPAAALGIQSANRLSKALKRGPVKVRLTLTCKNLPEVLSANVMGEITGSEQPEEVIVMGGHLDSWDLGQGAHDDGSGCVQAIEALRLIQELGLKPKRTIRVVLFMNEENGLRGGLAYAEYARKNSPPNPAHSLRQFASGSAKSENNAPGNRTSTKSVGGAQLEAVSPSKRAVEKHIAAIESDAGGFMPRYFGTSLEGDAARRLDPWLASLNGFGIERFIAGGGGGADIGPLGPLGTALFGLEPDGQRYFDYHHSNKDTIDKVNPRELQMGALAMAMLAWMLAESGD